MNSLVLDTHVFLWLLEGNPKLPATLRVSIEDPASDLYIPALVVAEMVDLVSKGRTRLDLRDLEVALRSDARLSVIAMSEEIALGTRAFVKLPDIHDRCIVATTAAVIKTVPNALLVTKDTAIQESGFVPTKWA